jgi:hypothetical protein
LIEVEFTIAGSVTLAADFVESFQKWDEPIEVLQPRNILLPNTLPLLASHGTILSKWHLKRPFCQIAQIPCRTGLLPTPLRRPSTYVLRRTLTLDQRTVFGCRPSAVVDASHDAAHRAERGDILRRGRSLRTEGYDFASCHAAFAFSNAFLSRIA